MILISKTTTGLLIQRDAIDVAIDAPAVPLALGAVIRELIDSGRAIGQARREGYEAGLIDGRERARIELETSARIAERVEADAAADLYTLLASAA